MTYILVTNDDGVHAPGILALATAVREFGELRVVAPSINQSASGHKKTLFQDIPYSHTELVDGTPVLAVGGSPADCIAVAGLGALEWPPRLVVSGINRGANMGQDVTYSGTVTAALEATIHGAPAVAFSLDNRTADHVDHYDHALPVIRAVLRGVLANPLPPLTILNVNIPAKGPVKGIRLTRQGIREYLDVLAQEDGIYRIEGDPPGGRLDQPGTDMWAVDNGYASVTPIHLDMTAHQLMAELGAWDMSLD
ncbi:MAG: 5'/3'-nucleotidase SurE [Chloroflexota bacterium]